eukprot:gene421-691_t
MAEAYNLSQATEWTEMRVALQNELTSIKRAVNDLQSRMASPMVEGMAHRVEFKVNNIREKMQNMQVGHSFFSPRFSAAGINEMQLEFFPLGRKADSASQDTCSLFLWCPVGVKIKYQLFVGSTIRQPEVDEFTSSMGHGHSNFCKIEPEIVQDKENGEDCITIGLQVVEAQFVTTRKAEEAESGGQAEGELRLITKSIQQICREESQFLRNQYVREIVWEIPDVARVMQKLEPNQSICSPTFCAAGIRDMLFEFYPKGVSNTTKDGWCALYFRCPEKSNVEITLHVGKVCKGPIKALYDRSSGKGLPEFCQLDKEIVDCVVDGQKTTKVVVKIQLKNCLYEEKGPTRLVLNNDSPYLDIAP